MTIQTDALANAPTEAEAAAARAQAVNPNTQALIAHLKLEIEKLRRQLYGSSSERKARLLQQMELQLEDLEAAATEDEMAAGRRAALRWDGKSWLLAGSKRGADRASAMATLIMTAKLNDVDPLAWLADVLARIAGIPQGRLHELLPWEWKCAASVTAQAA